MRVAVRTVEPADFEDCCEVEALSFPPEEAATRERIAQRLREYPEGFLVADADGRIAGHLMSGAIWEEDLAREALKDLDGHDPAAPNLVVFALAVHPRDRGLGVSRRLLEDFIARGRERGKARVLLLCKEDLVAYYRRFGFSDAGLSASTHGGVAWHEMRLRL